MKNFKTLFEKGNERDWQEIMARETKEIKYKKFRKRQMDFIDNYDRRKFRTSPKLREF